MRARMDSEKGAAAAEFALALPFIAFALMMVARTAAIGIVGITALLRTADAARAAAMSPPSGLSDAALRGGDTPSPYCFAEKGYSLCEYSR